MGVKEDIISLFSGHEWELAALPDTHFPIKDFTYMITSQRTTDSILTKLQEARVGVINAHQNFWPDLARLGLADSEKKQLTLFGNAVLDYFESEEDNFKREHFVFNGIRQKAYDIPQKVVDEYQSHLDNLHGFLNLIPPLNTDGNELLHKPKELLVAAFLNMFPYALQRFYQLSPEARKTICELGESGLKHHFENLPASEKVYSKPMTRLWNIWRTLDRRVIFVESAILSFYEEKCLFDRGVVAFSTQSPYEKLLNTEILKELIGRSEKIELKSNESGQFISLVPDARLPPESSKVNRRQRLVKKRRKSVMKRITNPEELLRHRNDTTPVRTPHAPSPSELAQRSDLLDERTNDHQKIVKKFTELYINRGFNANENNFDLLIETDKFIMLHEMKTTTGENERVQIIKAVGQLFYYEFYDLPQVTETSAKTVVKIVALEHKPLDLTHIEYLRSLDILVLWIGDNGEIEGDPDSIRFLREVTKS